MPELKKTTQWPVVFEEGMGEKTLVLLHGTGGNEHDLIPLAKDLAKDWPILSPRGRVREGSWNRWFARKGPGILDFEDVRFRAKELKDFLWTQAEDRGRDPHQLFALGYSNGANIAAAMMLLHPGVFAGAALLRPMMPLDQVEAPSLEGKKILVMAGKHDSMIPPPSTEELIRVLQSAQADLESHWAPADHGLIASELVSIQNWFQALGSQEL